MSQPDHDPPSTPIPSELHSAYEDRIFRACTRCGESLSDFEGGFQISKAFKGGECVFEYALCDHCHTSLMEEFSQESKARLAQFQEEHVQFDRGLQACAACGASREAAGIQEFVLTGICEGTSLLAGMMMCGKCSEDAQELISDRTRNTWRRFVGENFPGPPADALPLPEPAGHTSK